MLKEFIAKIDALFAPAGQVAIDRFCWAPNR
jgi:hypothetical protein